MCWLVLLIAAGSAVNLALYTFIVFAGPSVSDVHRLRWMTIAGALVACLLLPGAVLIARVEAVHNNAEPESTSQKRKWSVAVLRLDLEAHIPAMLRRGEVLVAMLMIGLAMEFASLKYIIDESEPQVIPDKWIEWLLAEILMIEGFVVATGAAALLVQIVLERLPRRRHRVLLGIGRPVFVHGLWVAAAFAVVSCGCYLLTLYVSWFCMIAITLSSIVTCVFAHLALRRAIRQTT